MELWWKKWPERLDFELAELKKNGIGYEFDSEAFERGSVVLRLNHVLGGQAMRLTARFPDLYPYFRFEVDAPELDLSKHQVPFGEKNLCLIGRSTANWNPSEDTLAKFLIEQLPKVLESARGGDEKLEESQGEPASEYYPYAGWMVMIDSAWAIDANVHGGHLTLGMDNARSTRRMAVLRVADVSGNNLVEAGPAIKGLYDKDQFPAKWVRIPEPIKTGDPREFFQNLTSSHPELAQLSWRRGPGDDKDFALLGVTFPEEVSYKQKGDGWIFILIYREKAKENKKKKWKNHYLFARAGRAGYGDMLQRIPNLAFLADKKIGVVGLGSIGAASAIEFARCGVGELRILDDDYIDPSTIIRWPLGHYYACAHKPEVLQHFISQNYPYTKVSGWKHRIGAPVSREPQTLVLENFLDGLDLVYDATAEVGVHHFLADMAKERNIPFVITSGTSGAWGGLIARFTQEKGRACWQCFERARTEGKLPLPPEDAKGSVQPIGCGNPTFTGTNFDLQEVALSGVRLSVSTLSDGRYPTVTWHAAILSLREIDNLLLPQWKILEIQSYPECSCTKKK